MPQFVTWVAALGTGVAATVGVTLASTGIALAVGAATLGLVTYGALRGAKLRDSGGGGAAGQQLLVRSTTEPRKIVYGEALVSGPLCFMNTTGTNNETLYTVVALTGHEVSSYQGYYLDDKFIPIADVDTAGDGSVDSDTNDHGYGPVGGTAVLYLRGLLGTAGQTVDTALDTAFTEWTSDHRARGCAYLIARMDQISGTEEVWQTGAPSNITALVRGKKVYDPRLDSTFVGAVYGSGSGAHRLATPSTWAYSACPPLCLADYLIDADIGAGFDSARIDYDSVAVAADQCDANVTVPPASSSQDRFSCNGVLSCGDPHRENVEKILSSMAGTLRYYNGLWRITAGIWPSASSFTLNESHLVGPITFRASPERTERYNAVRGVYFDPLRNYKSSQYLSVEDATVQTDRDDGLTLWKDLDLPMTNNEYMAQRLAFRMLEQASRTGVCVFPTGYNGLNIAPGDRGTVTIAELGWSSKEFRCVGLKHVDLVGVELILKEDDSAAYGDPAEGDYGTRTAAGTITFPGLRQNLSGVGQGQLVADPFFSRSTRIMPKADTDYRNYFWREAASHHDDSTAVIARTGGVSGDGVLQLTAAAFSGGNKEAKVLAIPFEGQYCLAGEYVIVTVRIRRTSASLTSPNISSAVVIDSGLGGQDGVIVNFGAEPVFTLTQTVVAGWTQNEWQQFDFLQELGSQGLTSFGGGYCCISIYVSSQNEELPIEVDAITLQRIQRP